MQMDRGHFQKNQGNKAFSSKDKKTSKHYRNSAEQFYKKALEIAKTFLGEHELTCSLCKMLGDLYFNMQDKKKALEYYSQSIKLREELKLVSNVKVVFLLKNYGMCLSYLRRFEESIEKFMEAIKIAKNLADDNHSIAVVCCDLAKTYDYWKRNCKEAVEYAEIAMKKPGLLYPRNVKKLQAIIERAKP